MDTEDRALQQAAQPLLGKLKVYVSTRRRAMDRQTFHEINQIVADEAVLIQQRTGLKLPKLVAIVLPCVGWISLARADMENVGIQRLVVNLIRRFPKVDQKVLAQELAIAVRAAFPQYKPSRLIELGGVALDG